MTTTVERVKITTNREFAWKDKTFHAACELAKVVPTKRQASKFRLRRGLAYAAMKATSKG